MHENFHKAVALWVEATQPRPRDERGLSQSTENAILLAGAVAVAALIIGIITVYVERNLPR
ncbi:hypothetical protein RPIT_14245 [Tessaracoccus flavus]|uniref:Uncharacterized protein n=2 Tax=Tessaracoccus flavus TaxID=1610493 RepID=A0A1Q2CI80_9ACTN|nr:hypothetical protein RPIT_14245 [Tessaracoccus flavus]SDZ14779.1 hypothetical protein SAMN05428934_11231 [Tessaracoccus flavus]